MSINKNNIHSHHDLRQRTETKLGNARIDIARMSLKKLQNQLYDFQVNQIELELQNEALQKTHLQLLATRDRYQKLYEYTPVATLTMGSQGYITATNVAVCNLFACSKPRLLGTKLGKYIHAEDQTSFTLFVNQLLKSTGNQDVEFRIKRANGTSITVACKGFCSHEKNNEHEVILTLQNISEQKKQEHAIYRLNEQLKHKICVQNSKLLDSSAKLQKRIKEIKDSRRQLKERETKHNSIFNAAVEGIVTINGKGIIQSVNMAVTKMFGFQTDELIGNNVNKLVPLSQRKFHNNLIENYFSLHKSNIIGKTRQLEAQRKDGTLFPIDLSISKYKIDHKTYFTGMIRDISDRKNKELLHKQHLDELAHVTRLGLMGEMASGIAHEVNQPLAAIATYSQISLRLFKQDSFDPINLQETLEKIEKQALRAGRIIARMREFISSTTPHRSTIDINSLVKTAISLAHDDCRQSSIECSHELADFLPSIAVDEVQIEQVLLNLIKNGIDVLSKLPKGTQRKLSVQTYLSENKFIEVRVKDNGPGINKDEQAKIFTPFFTTKTSGMGMGLSICQSLIKAHGGEIRFNTIANKGSTFYFTLPTLKLSDDH